MIGLRVRGVMVCLLFAVAAFGGLRPGPNVPVEFYDATLGDLNGDGLTDFVHGRFALINQGGGNFARHDFGLPGDDTVAATLDVNGDGRSDLLARDRPSAPPGSAKPATSHWLYLMGEQLVRGPAIALGPGLRPFVADVDADGKDDLVLMEPVFEGAVHLSTKVTVLISRGDGTFAARPSFLIAPNPYTGDTKRLATGDLNSDGIRDLVVRVQDGLAILLGTGGGGFAPARTLYVPARHFGGLEAHLEDIDGDRNLDVVLAAHTRNVRVLLGDGTGRFPRFASAAVPRLREPNAPAHVQQGRNFDNAPPVIGFGQFVRSGRTEILAATREGDLVVLAWENKKLREVARFETDFLGAQVYVGEYFQPRKTDVYVTAAIWNDGWRTPQLFSSESIAPASAEAIVRGRSRAVRGFAAPPTTDFDVQLRSDTCVTASLDTWKFSREGVFGVQRTAMRTVEMVLDEDILSIRFTAPWATAPVVAQLERKGRDYTGITHARTACGSSRIEMTVTPRH